MRYDNFKKQNKLEVFVFKKLSCIITLLALSNGYAAHYGMAGCGVGALVFKDQPGKIQIVAATLNNFVSPQTSAITSGTSGCYEENSSSAKLDYIEINKVSLKSDAARGNGETLSGLSTLLGCQNSGLFHSEVKTNYNAIFGQESAQEILEAIKMHTSAQQTCNTLG